MHPAPCSCSPHAPSACHFPDATPRSGNLIHEFLQGRQTLLARQLQAPFLHMLKSVVSAGAEQGPSGDAEGSAIPMRKGGRGPKTSKYTGVSWQAWGENGRWSANMMHEGKVGPPLYLGHAIFPQSLLLGVNKDSHEACLCTAASHASAQ